MSQRLPFWAVMPKHKKTVVITSKGWAVEETGELLTRVRDLDIKMASLGLYEAVEVIQDEVPVVIEKEDETVVVVVEEEDEEEEEEPVVVVEEAKEEVVPVVKKKPGRPKKVKAEE